MWAIIKMVLLALILVQSILRYVVLRIRKALRRVNQAAGSNCYGRGIRRRKNCGRTLFLRHQAADWKHGY